MKVDATGFAWYSREDYPRILEIMKDADQLPPTYDEWHERAEVAERELKTQGVDVVRAVIKPDVFVAWCAIRGLEVASGARTRFGSEAAATALEVRDRNTKKPAAKTAAGATPVE